MLKIKSNYLWTGHEESIVFTRFIINSRHAVRRFVQENQGLMRRMYGDERHINVLKAELERNDVDLKYDEYYHHFADDYRWISKDKIKLIETILYVARRRWELSLEILKKKTILLSIIKCLSVLRYKLNLYYLHCNDLEFYSTDQMHNSLK